MKAGSPKGATLAPWHVQLVLRYIEEHLDATMRMSDVVELTRLSTSHFSRAFKGTFGRTFSTYVIERRLARAQRLMVTTDASLAAIATDCGFFDQSHFNRLFRRLLGVPPCTWRRVRAVHSYFTPFTPEAHEETST